MDILNIDADRIARYRASILENTEEKMRAGAGIYASLPDHTRTNPSRSLLEHETQLHFEFIIDLFQRLLRDGLYDCYEQKAISARQASRRSLRKVGQDPELARDVEGQIARSAKFGFMDLLNDFLRNIDTFNDKNWKAIEKTCDDAGVRPHQVFLAGIAFSEVYREAGELPRQVNLLREVMRRFDKGTSVERLLDIYSRAEIRDYLPLIDLLTKYGDTKKLNPTELFQFGGTRLLKDIRSVYRKQTGATRDSMRADAEASGLERSDLTYQNPDRNQTRGNVGGRQDRSSHLRR